MRQIRRKSALILAFWAGVLGGSCVLVALHAYAFILNPDVPTWRFLVSGGLLASSGGMVAIFSRRV